MVTWRWFEGRQRDAAVPHELISRAAAKAAGAKRFFTGLPCVHGHVAERLVSSANCAECAAERQRVYRKTPEGREANRKKLHHYRSTPEGLDASRKANR